MSVLKANLLVTPQEIFTSSSTQGTDLGAFATTGDGRGYRYVLAGGTALVAGKLQQSPAETTAWQNLGIAASSAGSFTITTTSTVTVTANQLSGGFAAISVTPGVGYLYKIKSHPAATAAVVTLTLEDPIQVALTTSSKVDLIVNPYSSVIVNPATASGMPVGVAIYPVTASQYGWVQSQGVCNVLADGAITVGTSLSASNAVAGAVEPAAGVQALIGTAITGISDTEYGMVNLNIV